jgi:hypothetical protein
VSARHDQVLAAVEAALIKNPLPATVAELDDQSLRKLKAQAEREGITPEACLALARQSRADDLAARERGEDTDAVVRRVRRGY